MLLSWFRRHQRTHTHSTHSLLLSSRVLSPLDAGCPRVSYPVDILAPWPLPFACTPYSTMYSAMYPLIPTIPGIVDKALHAPPPPKSEVLRHGSSHASAIASSSLRRPSGSPIASSSIPIQDTGQVAVRCAHCSVCCSVSIFAPWPIIVLAHHHLGSSLGPAAMLPFKRQLAHHEPRCARCSAPAPAPCSFIPLLLLFFLSHARAIPMPVRSTSRPTVPRQERTYHPPGIRCVRPMALAPLDILEA